MGIISRSKRPSSVARWASWWERRANSSSSGRGISYSSAIISAPRPCPTTLCWASSSGVKAGPNSCWVFIGGGKGQLAHVLHAATDDHVVDAGGDLAGRQVHRLLGRAALQVDRRGRGLDREAGLEPGVAAHVQALGPELGHASRRSRSPPARARSRPARSPRDRPRRAARWDECPCSSPSPGARARSGVRAASTITTSRPVAGISSPCQGPGQRGAAGPRL